MDNIEAAIADLMAKGVRIIDEKPRYGAGGAKIAFCTSKINWWYFIRNFRTSIISVDESGRR